MAESRRAVVAGGTGFVGSHLVDLLLAKGYEVVSLDNNITGADANLAHAKANPRLKAMRQDVSEPFDLQGPVHEVYNLASPASPPDYLRWPVETLRVGSAGTQNLLELAQRKDARFLLASTSEVYGDPKVRPQPEGYWGNVNPVGIRGCYDEAKRYAEALTMAYHRSRGVDTRIARIFNTYGPRMRLDDGRVVPNFIGQALRGDALTVYGDGKQTRSFCYVSDLVDGLHRLMQSKEHLPVNLGNPDEWRIVDFAKYVVELTGSRSSLTFKELPSDDPKERCPDITRAKKILGWAPTVKLDEGMRRTIDHFRGPT